MEKRAKTPSKKEKKSTPPSQETLNSGGQEMPKLQDSASPLADNQVRDI